MKSNIKGFCKPCEACGVQLYQHKRFEIEETCKLLKEKDKQIAELKKYIRGDLNHCPDCHKYIEWPQSQWEGYCTEDSVCNCKEAQK